MGETPRPSVLRYTICGSLAIFDYEIWRLFLTFFEDRCENTSNAVFRAKTSLNLLMKGKW